MLHKHPAVPIITCTTLPLLLLFHHRVSDTMLNVWIALMFGSGIPFLYIAAFVVFIAQDLVDRQDLIRFCTQPVRYGPRLPRLVLGERLSYLRGLVQRAGMAVTRRLGLLHIAAAARHTCVVVIDPAAVRAAAHCLPAATD
jgi:hypothetical protein